MKLKEFLMSAIKCKKIRRNTICEGIFLISTDAEVRKHREQIGLESLVVYAVNDDY
jgi:hypothetical protein